MDKAREIMLNELVCCATISNVDELKSLMEKYNCTKIPVIDKNSMIIGAVSEVDLYENGVRNVVECMARKMCAIEEDDTVDECLKLMILNNVDQVAVINKQGHYRGLITTKQVLRSGK